MKSTELSTEQFMDLSPVEMSSIGGEGFAYDAGRFLRFLGLSASGATGMAQAICEVVFYNME